MELIFDLLFNKKIALWDMLLLEKIDWNLKESFDAIHKTLPAL